MTDRIAIHGLHVATPLYRFIEDQVLPAVGVKSKAFQLGLVGRARSHSIGHGQVARRPPRTRE
jgi:hypothetical protein